MKKIYIIFLLIVAGTAYGQSTHQAKNISQGTISSSNYITPNKTHNVYIARDRIELLPGFNSSHINIQSGQPIFKAEINEELILPVDYANPIDPEEREFDYSKTIGAIAGVADVSATGSATYNIPIYTPPGTAGMEPQISIAYNHHAGNGLLGIGWDIAGLSAITRVPSTTYHNGKIHEVCFRVTDNYAMDGVRLIVENGNPESDREIEYRTEIESYSWIKSYETTPMGSTNGPDYFIVKTKDGMEMEYGNTVDSKVVLAGNNQSILTWRLNKIKDINDNYIDYVYETTAGESYIKEIRYTGNSTLNKGTYNTISFHYEERDDTQLAYVAKCAHRSTKVLHAVKVRFNDQILRQYRFKYTKDPISSATKLIEVREIGRDGIECNPTIIEWGEKKESFTMEEHSLEHSVSGAQRKFFTGDFNGDGRTDFVYLQKGNDGKWELLYVYLANHDGATFSKIDSISLGGNTRNAFVLAPTYDGFSNIIIHESEEDGDKWSHSFKECRFLNNSLVVSTLHGHSFKSSYKYVNILSANFLGYGSINAPYMILDGNGACVGVRYMNLDEYPDFDSPDDLHLIDFDGDGKTDILVIKEDECIVYSYKDVPITQAKKFEAIYRSGFPTQWHDIFPGDFNGDGKTDLLTRANNGDGTYTWYLDFSNGINFTSCNVDLPFTFDVHINIFDKLYIGDFNGDGKSDICVVHRLRQYYPEETLFFYISIGDGKFIEETRYHDSPYSWDHESGDYFPLYYLGDFDGDGKQDFLFSGLGRYVDIPYVSSFSILHFHQNETSGFVHSITDGMNIGTYFSYLPILENDQNFYKKTVSTVNPTLEAYPIAGPLYVVSELLGKDMFSGKTLSHLHYEYKCAQMHRHGKGFFGFAERSIFDNFNEIITKEKYEYTVTNPVNHSDLRYRGALKEKSIYHLDTNELISKIDYYNGADFLTNNRLAPRIDSIKTCDLLKNVTVKEYSTWDDDGNLKEQTTKYEDGFKKIAKYDYEKKGGWGPLNRLKRSITLTYHDKYGNRYTSDTINYMYNNKGNLIEEKHSLKGIKNYHINERGVCYRSLVSAYPGSVPSYHDYLYENGDNRYRFITKTTASFQGDDDTHAYSTYDFATGLELTRTDTEGFTSSFQYDGFGRLVQTVSPEGHVAQTSYSWVTPQDNAPKSALYRVSSTAPGMPKVWTFHDILGREVQKRTQGFGEHEMIYTDTRYNQKGEVDSISQPYFSGATPKWRTFAYDSYGRMIEEKNNGLVTTTQYLDSENAVRVIPPDGNSVTKKFNAHGDVIEMTDNGGTVYYSYHHSWQPDTVKVGNAVFTMEYDQYGRQTHMHDPNAGTISTVFLGNRNLPQYTIDAKGNRTDYTYDDLNRVLTETSPEGTITYTYVKTGNARGSIERVMNSAGSGIVYQYDQRGRVSTMTEKVLGEEQTFTTAYEYDTYGNMVSMSYPGGFKVNRIYNGRGFLSEIRNASGNGLIWKREEQNALGQITKYKLGNEKTTTYTFDQYNLPKSIVTPGIQSFHYVIDPRNGNLRSREDRLKGLTETFGYDNLNRLDTIIIGSTQQILQYNAAGNITYKPDMGAYLYSDPDHIHAVTEIRNPSSDLLNLAGQEIAYNSFQKASYIQDGSGRKSLNIIYGVDKERVKTVLSENVPKKTKYFASNYEKEIDHATGTTRQINYVSTPMGVAAAYIQEGTSGELFYFYTDHLGSLTTITNQSGSRSEHRSYDAWGRLRNPDNWSYSNIPAMTLLDRGYTGHEHLTAFALINMNGRMYDPFIARFLSPDPYVHDIGGTQGFNRYSYCLNNPLKYTDPSGEWIHIAIGAAIGGIMNVIGNLGNISNFAQGFGCFIVGAGLGAATAATGGGLGAIEGFVFGAATGFGAGFVSGTANAWITGGDVRAGVQQGLRTGAIAAITSGVAGGISGAVQAYKLGLNPWTGTGVGNVSHYSNGEFVPMGEPTGFDPETNWDITGHAYDNFEGTRDYLEMAANRLDKLGDAFNGYYVSDGQLHDPKGNMIDGAHVLRRDKMWTSARSLVVVSPNASAYSFNLHQVLSHELTHAFHRFNGVHSEIGSGGSDYVAYRINAIQSPNPSNYAEILGGLPMPITDKAILPPWVNKFLYDNLIISQKRGPTVIIRNIIYQFE